MFDAAVVLIPLVTYASLRTNGMPVKKLFSFFSSACLAICKTTSSSTRVIEELIFASNFLMFDKHSFNKSTEENSLFLKPCESSFIDFPINILAVKDCINYKIPVMSFFSVGKSFLLSQHAIFINYIFPEDIFLASYLRSFFHIFCIK